jgi:hypothetical protein
MCTNFDTSAHAGAVPFVPHESVGTASEFIVVIGQNIVVLPVPASESVAHMGIVLQEASVYCRPPYYCTLHCKCLGHGDLCCGLDSA